MLNTFDNDKEMLLAAIQELTAEQAQMKNSLSMQSGGVVVAEFKNITIRSGAIATADCTLTAEEIADIIQNGGTVFVIGDFRAFGTGIVIMFPITTLNYDEDDTDNLINVAGYYTSYYGINIAAVYSVIINKQDSPYDQLTIVEIQQGQG